MPYSTFSLFLSLVISPTLWAARLPLFLDCASVLQSSSSVQVRPLIRVQDRHHEREGYPKLRSYFHTLSHIPERFLVDLAYFLSLSDDFGSSGASQSQLNIEAMAIFQGEIEGAFPGPATRSLDPAVDFFDSERRPWDVKSPVSIPVDEYSFRFDVTQVGRSIQKQLHRLYMGDKVRILLDVTYLRAEDRQILWRWIKTYISASDRELIREVFTL